MDIKTNKFQPQLLEAAINELVQEAKILFSAFDYLSSCICKLEKDLNEVKAYFPFKYKVHVDSESCAKKPESRHDIVGYDLLGYRTRIHWYFSWEAEENARNFRLFLIGEEKEIIYYTIPGDDPDACGEQEFLTKNIFKKPLMETNLSTRIQYSENLISFINSFRFYLSNCRIVLEKGKPFFNEQDTSL